ncbi:MAG: transporter substrate-binding domain-containing protein [Thermoleophilia bacterium]
MRKVIFAMALAVVTAAALAALGAAATSSSGPSSAAANLRQAKAKLPPLPAEVKARKRWIIGVKCDAPPFGYIDVKGRNAGVDVEIAKWFSRFAFGREDRVSFTCAPTPTREPLLTNDRADLVIATFTYTPDRDTRIDFSRAYYKATGRMLVPNNSSISSVADLNGKAVATTSGSIYDRWVRKCFTGAKLSVFDNFTNARLAFEQGRADTLMFDDTVLLGIATADPRYKLAPDSFLALPYGIGIKQGNVAMKKWVDSRLEIMRKRDQFVKILKNNVANRFIPIFSKNVLRPKQNFGYTSGDPSAVCP